MRLGSETLAAFLAYYFVASFGDAIGVGPEFMAGSFPANRNEVSLNPILEQVLLDYYAAKYAPRGFSLLSSKEEAANVKAEELCQQYPNQPCQSNCPRPLCPPQPLPPYPNQYPQQPNYQGQYPPRNPNQYPGSPSNNFGYTQPHEGENWYDALAAGAGKITKAFVNGPTRMLRVFFDVARPDP